MSEYDFGEAPSFIEEEQLEFRQEVVLEDASRYLGEWLVGTETRQGRGRIVWSNGSVYIGWWRDDMANGEGQLTHNNGEMYKGNWENDRYQGYGVYKYPNGTEYKGEW